MEIAIVLMIAIGLIADDAESQAKQAPAPEIVVAPLPVCDVAFADLSRTFSVRQYRNLDGQPCQLGAPQ